MFDGSCERKGWLNKEVPGVTILWPSHWDAIWIQSHKNEAWYESFIECSKFIN